jgi:hypothetical protein
VKVKVCYWSAILFCFLLSLWILGIYGAPGSKSGSRTLQKQNAREAAGDCPGDVNLDGLRNALDLVLLLRHVRGTQLLTGDGLANADVDKSGSVNQQDVTRLRQHIVGAQPLASCPSSTKPIITSISPGRGTAGSQVTISGLNFGSTAAANTVKFNDTTATIISAGASQLVVTAPNVGWGGSYFDVTVTAAGITSAPATFIIDRFEPTIEVTPLSLLPGSSPPIYIKFSIAAGDMTASRMQINFNNVRINTTRFAGMTSPQGIGRGYVTSTSSWVPTAHGIFLVTEALADSLKVVFSGSDGSQGGSDMVQGQIRATQAGFVMDLNLNLPSLAVSDLGVNRFPLDLIAYLDAGLVTLPPAAGDVFSVASSFDAPAPIGGKAVNKTIPQNFSCMAPAAGAPRIQSIEPFSCSFRQEITLRGSGFSSNPADNTVTFAGTNNTRLDASVLTATSDALTVMVPAMATSGPVQVTRAGTKSNDFSIWVLYSPSISVSLGNPAAGQATAMTINIQEAQFQMATQNFLLTTDKGSWNFQALQKGAQIGTYSMVGLFRTSAYMVVEDTDGSTFASVVFKDSSGDLYDEARIFLNAEQPAGTGLSFVVVDQALSETAKLFSNTNYGSLRFTAPVFRNPAGGMMKIESWLTSCATVPGTKNVTRAAVTQQVTVP